MALIGVAVDCDGSSIRCCGKGLQLTPWRPGYLRMVRLVPIRACREGWAEPREAVYR